MGDAPRSTVRFRGRPLSLPRGATLVQALVRGRLPILQRSIRYHRPRAPSCGTGACSQCLVRVNGRPNVRACLYRPATDDVIRTENAWPSPEFDLFGALDAVFPRGLDTVHGFRRPAVFAPLYHRVIRRLAGFGRMADTPGPTPPPGRTVPTDALVVGAGPSGRAAAQHLASAGRSTVLVDRGSTGDPLPGVTAYDTTTVVFLPPPLSGGERPFRAIAVRDGGEALRLAARTVVVATGGYDGPLLFPGNDRPGVMTAEGALAFTPPGGDPPFRRALLVGGGPRAAELLDAAGAHIEAVVAPTQIAPTVVGRASALGIPLYPRTLLLAAKGRHRLRSVLLRRRGEGAPFSLEVDAVVLAHRRLPQPQLFFQAGARMAWRSAGGAYFPVLTDGATSVPGLFACGTAVGHPDRADAAASGVAAADAALGRTGAPAGGPTLVPDGPPHELEGYYRELLDGARRRGKWVLCPCEDVLLREVETASRGGYRGIEVIKRFTGIGTGLCQGRYCLPDALLLLAILEGRPPSDVGYITQRPPVVPVPLGALAELPDAPEAA